MQTPLFSPVSPALSPRRSPRAGLTAGLCLLALVGGLLPASVSAQRESLNDILFEAQIPAEAPSLPAPRRAHLPVVAPSMGSGAGAADTTADDYLESIASIELEGGPYAPELLEQYLALGESYQQRNDHEAALAAFEKADHVSRINHGLQSPEQIVIVENMIESYLAQGELFDAANKERYLLSLREHQYGLDSLELVPALAEVGDWNFTLFSRQLTLPNTVFSFGTGGGASANQSPRMLAFGSLYQSQTNYWRAINIMLSNGRYTDPELRELERKLIETSFLTSNREGLLQNPDFYMSQRRGYTGSRIRRSTRPSSPYFFTGRSAYERLIAYNVMTPNTDAVTIAQTLIGLGDWNLLFDRQGAAIKAYRRAHDFMVENQVPAEVIDSLLSPDVPQQLPVFTPLPNSRAKFGIAPDAAVQWDGYVDVSFRIMRFGQVENFEVLGHSGPLTEDMEKRLRRLLRSSPFRPRFVDGEPAKREQVTVRYNFAQL